MDISKVGVVGCGLMGSGIAEIAAKSGFDVVVREMNDELLQKGQARIQKSMDRAVKKEKLTAADRDAAGARLSYTTHVSDLAECDIIIEAIVEELDAKNALFGELDGICGDNTIFASNTSSLTITDMAAATERADRFVGL
ncbi:MAG: 3-hydroxybutyryl-CoA dehydrogenase, partial [Gemmatimonadales bacterium]|nr:3-hydroxybutyryl-CoA dehydrogenase [Gemmatimonadales bacterium]